MKSAPILLALVLMLVNPGELAAMRVLNFQADNGFAHDSKSAALRMVEDLGKNNGREVVTTTKASSLTELDWKSFAVVVFNNNCDDKETSESAPAMTANGLPVVPGLFLDLDADKGVEIQDGDKVEAWRNQVAGNAADVFVKRDEGRKVAGSGRPTLKTDLADIGGHNTLVFRGQELVNMDDDAFDHCIQGSGYTWFSVMSAYQQIKGKPDVNSFFGNLKNGPNYEGFWACLADDNRVWMGTRGWPTTVKGKQPLWNDKNPQVISPTPLRVNQYYVVAGRMGAGTGLVNLGLYLNSATAVDTQQVPVNPKANPSKMAIGQERDATNHPGLESFDGEISRFLVFDRPLTDEELGIMIRHLMADYEIPGSLPHR